ncbi:MAG: hypothetical protein QOG48_13, partial [Verrucomicrobiota bacterium]
MLSFAKPAKEQRASISPTQPRKTLAAAARTNPVLFMVAEGPGLEYHRDSYVLPLTNQIDIDHARRLINEGPGIGLALVVARIAAGADGINRDYLAPIAREWSWHVTELIDFADGAVEILDGWPGYVEQDVPGWIQNTGGAIGFASYTVVAEIGGDIGIAGPPTFGHPVISGIGGNGFEDDLRLDPSNPTRIYMSSPGALDTNTSWIWRSIDGGKTFKWVPGAAPFQGKVTTCQGGADTELAVDTAGHLYFNDLTFANFSTARSDDGGTTFTCVNTGTPDAVLDRQWYAVDGDPTNGGNLYLAANENGPGGTTCGSSGAPNNVSVMYRSPVIGNPVTAGIQFGLANKITPNLGCDSGLPGNNEVSPVATTLGQPNGSGGFATLSTPVKHVYAVHDDANHHQVRIGRCFPVAFGQAVANVSDPSGLNCTDILVAELGTTGVKTGGTFLTMAIDKAGNLYVVWEQAPIDGSGQVIGDTVLKYSYSIDQGNTWAAPIQIDTSGSPVGTLHNNVFAWIAAGDDGKIDIAWYGTPGTAPVPSFGPDSCACDWSVWLAQSLNAHDATPVFTPPILASEHFIHRGSIMTFGIG